MLRTLLAILITCLVTSHSGCATTRGLAPPAAAAPWRLAVIGDFGEDGPDEAAVASLVHSWEPQDVITLGDNNYPKGGADTIDANIGKHYHRYIRFDRAYRGAYGNRQATGANHFFPALGNHDWDTALAQPYFDYFDLPGNERYYQVRLGPVGVFILDSDPREPDGIATNSKQANWLKGALAASDAPWKLVVLHHPPYSSGSSGDYPVLQWPFKAWGASMVLAGHDHHYERMTIDGLPYLVVGSSGAHLFPATRKDRPYARDNIIYNEQHGAALLHATQDRLTLQFFNAQNSLIDTLTLQRNGR